MNVLVYGSEIVSSRIKLMFDDSEVVLLDMKLRDMDGFEALSQVRNVF